MVPEIWISDLHTPFDTHTKNQSRLATDTGCDAFATANGCTFADLLKWNDKLRPDCLNLDVGHPLCVSITPGAGGNTNVTTPAVPKPTTSGAAVPTSASVPVKPTTSGAATTTTTGAANPVSTVAKGSSATSTKASMLLGAAGVIMSAVYML